MEGNAVRNVPVLIRSTEDTSELQEQYGTLSAYLKLLAVGVSRPAFLIANAGSGSVPWPYGGSDRLHRGEHPKFDLAEGSVHVQQ
jgi:hypothetical protein